jgi:hypothetical protein
VIRVTQLLVVAAAVGLLAACSASPAYSDLERAATATDVLPGDLPAYAAEDFIDGSVRLVGAHDGVEYFLAWSASIPNGACVVAFRSADEWVGGCGGPGGAMTLSGGGTTVVLASDDLITAEAGTPVGSNLVVVD